MALGHGFTLEVRWLTGETWRTGETPLRVSEPRTLADLGVIAYRSADDLVVTPTLGTMANGLHPFLALWSTLLALSSLARYEPASWSKLINIDRSAEANPIEHFLDEAVNSIAQTVRHVLTTIDYSTRP
ncbi:YaaC family protein [Actinosynnema sp. CS-041913]|uniref:YaaC family protein n=1 Tax=Actinosynnema sp. CS-041913 TaxID=3239917 RepID=UPI003D8A9439